MRHTIQGWLTKMAFLALGLAIGSLPAAEAVHQVTVGPDQNLAQVVADVPQGSKALITVLPGTYNTRRLLKHNVDWHFMQGAVITNMDTNGNLGGWGIFDDRGIGAVTSTISGNGVFSMLFTTASTNMGGVIMVTNPASRVTVKCNRIIISYPGGVVNAGFAAIHSAAGTNSLEVDEIEDPLWLGVTFDDEGTPVTEAGGANGIYWEAGDLRVKAGRIQVAGYGYYGSEPSVGATNNFWLEVDEIRTFFGACIYQVGINSSQGYKAWIKAKEIRRDGTDGFSALSLYGGKFYLEAEKVGITNATLPAVLMESVNQEAWLTIQKLSAGFNWLNKKTGTLTLAVQEYEDVGTLQTGLRIVDGVTTILPGVARVKNGKGVEHLGGTNRLIGLTIDTRGTNVTAGVTNNRPVTLAAGSSNLVLHGCALLSPIGTAGGGAYSLFATSGVANVLVYNGGMANSNWNAGINIAIGTMATNQTQMR